MDEFTKAREVMNEELREAARKDPLHALTAVGAVERDIAARRRDAVRAAVQHHSWAEIGEALGVSKQAAHQRFAKEWAETLKGEIKAAHAELKAARRDGANERAAVASTRRAAIVAEFKNANRRRT
jgi:hypothetical protein